MRIPQRVANGRRIPLSSGTLQRRETTSAERLSSSFTSTYFASTLRRSLSSGRSSRKQRSLLVIGIALVALGACIVIVSTGLFALRLWLDASETRHIGSSYLTTSSQQNETELSESDEQLKSKPDEPLVNIPFIKNLTLSRRIPIRRSQDLVSDVAGMTGGAAANQLFIAQSNSKGVVSSFNTQSGQVENDVHTNPKHKALRDVAYNAYSKTLFIATYYSHDGIYKYIFRAFKSISANNWTQIYQIESKSIETFQWIATLRVLPDNTLLFGEWNTDGVYVCPVHQNQTPQVCKRLALTEKHWGFDVRSIGNETLLVAALKNAQVGIYRLESERCVKLYSVEPFRPFDNALPVYPLFIGSTLLVAMAPPHPNNNFYFKQALSYRITDGQPQFYNYRHIVLQGAREIYTWCLMNATLFVWDKAVNIIFVYTLQYQ